MAKPKPNKYDAILPGLPPRPVEDRTRQALIDKEKEGLPLADPFELGEIYKTLRLAKTKIEEDLYDLNVKIDAVAQALVMSHDEEDHGWGAYGMKKNAIRLESGETIRIKPEPWVTVIDKDMWRRWCIENGYGNKLQLWPSTTTSVVRERLAKGQPEPAGTRAFRHEVIVFVKAGETAGEEGGED